MKNISKILMLFLALSLCILPVKDLYAGFGGGSSFTVPETDTTPLDEEFDLSSIFYFFDLRERETFIQLTNPDALQTGLPAIAHIQIFDVSNNCNENNFFDNYTVNDTHVYNMRDIQTNDGNPSGVTLPDGAYGIVAVTMFVFEVGAGGSTPAGPIGNLRIIGENGHEYRTNAQSGYIVFDDIIFPPEFFYSFNFNQNSGVSWSDVVGISIFAVSNESVPNFEFEWMALPVQGIFTPFDIDIYDLNEVPFSCRDIIFSCVDENNPLIDEVLAIAGSANVAAFEYGINNAIPHTQGGELLCPNNTVGDGVVVLRPEPYPDTEAFNNVLESICGGEGECQGPYFFGFVGLNNGDARGSLDSFWVWNINANPF